MTFSKHENDEIILKEIERKTGVSEIFLVVSGKPRRKKWNKMSETVPPVLKVTDPKQHKTGSRKTINIMVK